jgi:two-component system LytT family sensor kinase
MSTASVVRDRPALTSGDWLLLLVGWSVFGLVQALVGAAAGGFERAVPTLLVMDLPLAWLWAVLTPAIGKWNRWLGQRVPNAVLRVALHLPTLALVALARAFVLRTLTETFGGTLTVPFSVTLLYFLDLTVIGYVAAVWASYAMDARRRLLDQQRRTHALESQLSEARLQYLEMQIRPHFLFNALSSVSELGHESPQSAARMLRNIASLLTSAAERSAGTPVTLAAELEAITPYIEIQRIRFSDWLMIDLRVEPEARHALVPPFILQPLIENAVHHGLVRRTDMGRITIAASVRDGRLVLRVSDNGEGLRSSAYRESRGLGLRNVRSRLLALYGDSAALDLRDESGGGTAACLDLPFRDTANAPEPDGGEVPAPPAPGIITAPALRWLQARPVAAAIIVWSIVGLLRIQHSIAYMLFRDRMTAEALQSAIRFDLTGAAVWLVVTPLVVWLARALPLRGPLVSVRFFVHTVCAFAVALGQTALSLMLLTGRVDGVFSQADAQVYAFNVAAYAIIVALVHLRQVQHWMSERELAASRLRLELQEARFQKVMLDLRPRVLIETLHHLEQLVQRDPVRAEQILAEMGDFLRQTLDSVYEPELTVRQECDRLRAYARVLSAASAPNFQLRLVVPLSLMDEVVPNGVLRAAIDSVVADQRRSSLSVLARLEKSAAGVTVTVSVDNPAAEFQTTTSGDGLMGYVDGGAVQLLERNANLVRLLAVERRA